MDWKDRMERRMSWMAIPGLIRYVAIAQFMVFILTRLVPEYVNYLTLDPQAILHGQVWRLISWILVPQTFSFFWILFAIMWLWFLGDFLESVWGTFRTNVFFWVGVIGCTAGAFLVGSGGAIFTWYLNLSILFAFATLDPDHPLYFFFIQLKAQWLAYISLGFLVFTLFTISPLEKVALLLAFANYLIFFVPTLWREARHAKKARARREQFTLASLPEEQTLHRCHICGATEVSAPDMDFRISVDGQEYCMQHLPPPSAA